MGILETVKKGFSLMVSSLSVVGIFFAYGAVTNFINVQFTSQAQNNAAPASNPMVALAVILSLLSVFAGLYLQAGSMGYFKEKLQTGKSSLGSFFGSGARYFVPLMLFGLIVMAIVAVASIGSVVMVRSMPRPVAILGSAVLILTALFFVVMWFLAPYAIVVNGKTVPAAMKESAELVKKHLVKVILIGLVLVVVGFVTGFIFGLITGVGGAVINQSGGGAVPQSVIGVISSVVNAFLGVFMTSTYMYFYLKATHQEHATT